MLYYCFSYEKQFERGCETVLRRQKGFTLIELLIVIVIIGILAGVLIAIINPGQQQNRARDANVKATMNKVVLATEAFVSAYGRLPTDVEFIASLDNSYDCVSGPGTAACGVGTCTTGTPAIGASHDCQFWVTGNELQRDGSVAGDACGGSFWSAAGDNDCFYHYFGEAVATAPGSTHFRIAARSFGLVDTVFVFDNALGEIIECSLAAVADIDHATAVAGTGCN